MENNELEEMRAQLALLNEKLEKQELISKQLCEKSVNSKYNDLKKRSRIEVYGSLLASVLVLVVFFVARNSICPKWFILGMLFVCLIFIVLSIIIDHKYLKSNIMSEDLNLAQTNIAVLKDKTMKTHLFEYGIATLFVAYELYLIYGNKSIEVFIICCLVFAIMYFVGYFYEKKIISIFDEIISQLKEE